MTLQPIQALGWRVLIGGELVDIDEAADLGGVPDNLDQGAAGSCRSTPMELMIPGPFPRQQD